MNTTSFLITYGLSAIATAAVLYALAFIIEEAIYNALTRWSEDERDRAAYEARKVTRRRPVRSLPLTVDEYLDQQKAEKADRERMGL